MNETTKGKPDRAARLAEELRANLAKRKAQARSRHPRDKEGASTTGNPARDEAPAEPREES